MKILTVILICTTLLLTWFALQCITAHQVAIIDSLVGVW